MCQCTLISDVHYHIIPYVHFHSPVSPGSPRHGVTQPSDGFASDYPCTPPSLAESKGTLLCPSSKAAGARRELYNTLYYSKSAERAVKTIPSHANKRCALRGLYFFLPPRTENRSLHCRRQMRRTSLPPSGAVPKPLSQPQCVGSHCGSSLLSSKEQNGQAASQLDAFSLLPQSSVPSQPTLQLSVP